MVTYDNAHIRKTNNRNSLIEFYRFLLALWIAFGHGFFPGANGFDTQLTTPYFQYGGKATALFYVICGFFLVPAIIKQNDKPFGKGLGTFTWKKIKNLGFITLIGLVIQIWLAVWAYGREGIWNKDHTSNVFNYIWYIMTAGSQYWFIFGMIVASILFFALYRICRKHILIFLLILPCFIFYNAFHYGNRGIDSGMAIFSALSGMALGILVSYVPPIKCHNTIKWICVAILFVVIIYFIYLPKQSERTIYSDLIWTPLFPMLIYFSSQVDLPKENIFRKIFLYLGSLSIPLYVGQSILTLMITNMLSWGSTIFVLLLIIALLTCKQNFVDVFFKKRIKAATPILKENSEISRANKQGEANQPT